MRWFRFALLILAVTVLQKGLLARWSSKPDLLVILLVFLVGSPMPMGPHMISFGLFGTILAYMHRVIAMKRMPYQALAIFIISILTGVLTHLLAYFTKGEPVAANIYAVVFVTSLYSSIVGPFLFLPAAWCMRIKISRFGRR
ncbi:MAG: hypothetical protein ACYSUX_12975 [Planctomycetota bacterium]|jgi:cell shape-determining protein MreD